MGLSVGLRGKEGFGYDPIFIASGMELAIAKLTSSKTTMSQSRCFPTVKRSLFCFMSGELGLHIHWPFCQSKCPYCDFNSLMLGIPLY